MARIVPYAAIQFSAHEQWKHFLGTDQPGLENKLQFTFPLQMIYAVFFSEIFSRSSTPMRFLAGSLAGVTAQSLTYPLDLARARMAVTHRDMYGSIIQVGQS